MGIRRGVRVGAESGRWSLQNFPPVVSKLGCLLSEALVQPEKSAPIHGDKALWVYR